MRRTGGLDGGRLWVFVVKQQKPLGLLLLACRVFFRGLRPARDLDVVRCVEAEIRTHASRVPVARDGEVHRMRGPLRYSVLAGALTVFAPPEEPAA